MQGELPQMTQITINAAMVRNKFGAESHLANLGLAARKMKKEQGFI